MNDWHMVVLMFVAALLGNMLGTLIYEIIK